MAAAVASAPGATNNHDDDFPMLCDSCLGPNPYIRMMKSPAGGKCQICARPFTTFHWRPGGANMRTKKTEVCVPCARAQNCCQTCIHDLETNLPIKVRDASLAAADRHVVAVGGAAPRSDGMREYMANQTERNLASGAVDAVYNAPRVNKIAERLQRKTPNYSRNQAKVCTFFLANRCKKGPYCPFRHERPDENRDKRLDNQNIRDRYYGTNDPVADKMLARVQQQPQQQQPGKKPTPLPPRETNKMLSRSQRYGWSERDDLEPRGGASGGSPSGPGSASGGFARPSTPSGSDDNKPGSPRPYGDERRIERRVVYGNNPIVNAPQPPADTSIMELYIGGDAMQKVAREDDLRDLFAGCEGLSKIVMKHGFAFAMFSSRQAAERAMEKCHGAHSLCGRSLQVKWGTKSKRDADRHLVDRRDDDRPAKRPRY